MTTDGVRAWIDARSSRERTLLALAAGVAGTVLALVAGTAVRDDLGTLRARVAAHERELAEVRRLAGVLTHARATEPTAGDEDVSLPARLEALATPLVGRERIASMTPVAGSEGDQHRVAVRLADVSLTDTVRLLHAFENGPRPLAVARLELQKHRDAPSRFDATLEVSEAGGGS